MYVFKDSVRTAK